MVYITTEPSLALLKYWGKAEKGVNLPATTSIAVSLGGLTTETEVAVTEPDTGEDELSLNGTQQHDRNVELFLQHLRSHYPETRRLRYHITSRNSFPTAAGVASSSSGFAALAIGCTRAAGLSLSPSELSQLARFGSGSAARAVFGGFTSLPAGSRHAVQLYDHTHWPELRIVVVMVSPQTKPLSSRAAMEQTRHRSPYYRDWCILSESLTEAAEDALYRRSLTDLGPLIRRSYLAMFGSMLAADPPILYWLPDSVRLIHRVAAWRSEGIEAWETMDAGPQVKLITTTEHLAALQQRLAQEFPELSTIVADVGRGPRTTVKEGA